MAVAWSLYLVTDLCKYYHSYLGCSEEDNLLQEWLLDVLLEVSRVGEDAAGEEEDEQDEDEGEVGGQHALALLPGPEAAEEGHDGDEGGHHNDDVGGGGVEGDVEAIADLRRELLLGLFEEVEEAGLVHEDPDATAKHAQAQQLEGGGG